MNQVAWASKWVQLPTRKVKNRSCFPPLTSFFFRVHISFSSTTWHLYWPANFNASTDVDALQNHRMSVSMLTCTDAIIFPNLYSKEILYSRLKLPWNMSFYINLTFTFWINMKMYFSMIVRFKYVFLKKTKVSWAGAVFLFTSAFQTLEDSQWKGHFVQAHCAPEAALFLGVQHSVDVTMACHFGPGSCSGCSDPRGYRRKVLTTPCVSLVNNNLSKSDLLACATLWDDTAWQLLGGSSTVACMRQWEARVREGLSAPRFI